MGVMLLFLGFILAPLAGALTFAGGAALYDHIYAVPFQRVNIFTVIAPLMIGGYPVTIVLGVPAYFLLRNRVKDRLVTTTLVGGTIACLPWLVICTLLNFYSSGPSGWAELMYETTIPAFGCGCVSGSVFWLIAHKGRARARPI